jgi:HlyD family secretion protein
LDRLKVTLDDAKQKLERARLLSQKNLLPRTELETAEVAVQSTQAQIRSSEAALSQARSQLRTAEVNLNHTVIKAPIDGIVISRSVEPGQTVNAGMSAPTLFILAADLTEMQVLANIDEADVGRMRPGQPVTFRVDAFQTEGFTGTVQQVRLQPSTVQNVVTYQTVIAVPNRELKLKPGMTANVNIEVARRSNVLRIPAAAARFRPTNDAFAALKQPVPVPEPGRSPRPEGAGSERPGQVARVAAARTSNAVGRIASAPVISSKATTIDALFGPLPAVETRGRVWVYENKQLTAIPVRLGLTDGTFTELLDPNPALAAGKELVTNVTLATAASAAPAANAGNPLMGPQRGGPGGGRGPGGGARGF